MSGIREVFARVRHTGRRPDEGIAMLTAIMLVMVVGGFAMLTLALVANQVRPTLFSEKSTRTIFAAEAGVESALGRIRTAQATPDFTGRIYGDPRQLPCTVTGSVEGAAGTSTYTTQVRYFMDDPAGRSDAWLSSNAMTCSPTNGTGTALPAYALITSKGQAPTGSKVAASQADRGISMTYKFETTTQNVAGGRIYNWNSGFCLRANGLTAGSTVKYRSAATCGSSANEDYELWIYDSDYTLTLASSTTSGTKLCLSYSGSSVTLASCGSPAYNQLWAWHSGGNATWVGQNSSINDDTSKCLFSGRTSGNPVDGDNLQVGSCQNQTTTGAFSPDPAVGPGAASANTRQIVNYLEFGRCFDVTDTDVGKAFMISYPCKQDPPAASGLYWNHKWFYEEPLVGTTAPAQLIFVYSSAGTQYCLQSPTGATNPSSLGSAYYPTLTSSCSLSNTAQRWTRSTGTGDKATSWTIRDSTGRCVGLGPNPYVGKWSTLVVTACNGSSAQKWNAPADEVEAEVGNYLEETG